MSEATCQSWAGPHTFLQTVIGEKYSPLKANIRLILVRPHLAVRIYDPESKKNVQDVTLFLTPAEAKELADSASDLAAHPEKHHHHIPDDTHTREITIAVYTPENRAHFDAESSRIIDAS